MIGCFFFFKQKTAYEMRISDWSSDVCSSDLAELGSTNDWLADAARQGAPEGQWVRADRQTGGRGRRGRTWVSEPGNLYASTLIRLRGGDPPAQQLGFVAALALHRALSAWAPAARLSLKWPNDLLMDGAKLSGILREREGRSEERRVGKGCVK